MVGEQVVDVDKAADRILECKAGIAEIAKRFEIRNESSVFGLDVFVLTNSFDCQESDSTIMLDYCTVHRSSCSAATFVECFMFS